MANLTSANAYLQYNNNSFYLWVMRIEQGHDLAGSLSQAKAYQHFYPRSYYPGPMMITGRVRNQAMYDDLAEFIRGHQLALIADSPATNRPVSGKLPLMEFNFPDENIHVTGWVTPFTAGAKRFNVAPEFTLNFVIAADRHSTNDRINPSFTTRGWWTGAFLDFDQNGPSGTTSAKTKTSTPRDTNQYKWPDKQPDPPQLTQEPIIVQVLSGGAQFGIGGGTAGSGNYYGSNAPGDPATMQGHQDAIAAGAPGYSDPKIDDLKKHYPPYASFGAGWPCIPPDLGKCWYGGLQDEGRIFGVGHDQSGTLEHDCATKPPHIHVKYRQGGTVGVPV